MFQSVIQKNFHFYDDLELRLAKSFETYINNIFNQMPLHVMEGLENKKNNKQKMISIKYLNLELQTKIISDFFNRCVSEWSNEIGSGPIA